MAERGADNSAELRTAHRRFKLAAEAEARIRREALDDLKFRTGEQWPADIVAQRNREGRPCLTTNRLPQFLRQVTNEQRAQRPAIEVNPVGGGADVETAEIYQGLIRHIEVSSDAEIAYDTAYDAMVGGGFGYFRAITEYAGNDGFAQEIKIKRVKNPFSVYFDPGAVEADYSDARYCFVVEDIPREDFRAQFRDSAISRGDDMRSIGDAAPGWVTEETVRVAEYFRVEIERATLYELPDGTLTTEAPPGGAEVSRSRPVDRRKVLWRKISGAEVLEATEWPGSFIPVVPVLGDDLDVDGERYLAGLVRGAKDPQRMYNFWVSAATEMIALAPRAPFIVAEGQTEGREEMWRDANVRSFATLVYKPTTVAGSAAPPPQRQVYEPPIQAIAHMVAQADNDLKATMGIYDAALGKPGPEQSGRAVLARQKQTDISVLNFSDNLARSLRHLGRILVDLIPKVYDEAAVRRIVKPDGTVKTVGIVNSQSGAGDPASLEGVDRVYDIGVGKYDVTVSVGPSYQTRRQEAAASQIELVKANPALFQLIGDLMVGNMDWPGAQEIAKRLRAMLPPQVQQIDGDDPEAKLMAMAGQLHQLVQQHQLLSAELQKASRVIAEKQVERQTKLELAKIQSDTQIAVAEINTKAQESSERLKWQMEAWRESHNAAHELAMDSVQAANAPETADTPAAPQAAQA